MQSENILRPAAAPAMLRSSSPQEEHWEAAKMRLCWLLVQLSWMNSLPGGLLNETLQTVQTKAPASAGAKSLNQLRLTLLLHLTVLTRDSHAKPPDSFFAASCQPHLLVTSQPVQSENFVGRSRHCSALICSADTGIGSHKLATDPRMTHGGDTPC